MKNERPLYLKRHAWGAMGYCPCGWRRIVLGQEGALCVLFINPAGVAGELPRVCERAPRRRRKPVQLLLFK